MKISVNTNSLRKKFSNREIVELIRQVGAGGIEWGLNGLDTIEADCKEMKQLSDDAGMEVVSFINGGPLFKTEEILRWSEAVANTGVRMLRVAHPWYAWDYEEALHQPDRYDDLIKMTREGLERLEQVGQQFGIRYVMETHGSSVFASPVAAHFLVAGLDPKLFGIIYDPANTYIEGFVRPRGAVEIIGPYMAYLHIKNLRWKTTMKTLPGNREREVWVYEKCALDQGLVDYQEVFFALNCAGLNPWLSFEEMYSEKEQIADEIRSGITHLRQCHADAPKAPQEPFKSFNR